MPRQESEQLSGMREQGLAVILNAGDNGHNQHYYFKLCSYGSLVLQNLSFFWEFLRGGLFYKKDHLLRQVWAAAQERFP